MFLTSDSSCEKIHLSIFLPMLLHANCEKAIVCLPDTRKRDSLPWNVNSITCTPLSESRDNESGARIDGPFDPLHASGCN